MACVSFRAFLWFLHVLEVYSVFQIFCNSSSPAATVFYCIKAICFTVIAMVDGTHVLIISLFLLEIWRFVPSFLYFVT